MFPRAVGRYLQSPYGLLPSAPHRVKLYTMCPVQNVHYVSVLTGTPADARCRLPRPALSIVKRIKEKLVRCVRLAAPLRLEAQQDHVALAVLRVECRGFALDGFGSRQVAALERRSLARIPD